MSQDLLYNGKEFLGKVIWFKAQPGYGFIDWEGEQDMFVHFSGIDSEGFRVLKKGQKVSFKVGLNNKEQPVAVEVKVVE